MEDQLLVCFVICCICKDTIKVTNNKGWSLGNFYRHIQQKHNESADVPEKKRTQTTVLEQFFSKSNRKEAGANGFEEAFQNSILFDEGAVETVTLMENYQFPENTVNEEAETLPGELLQAQSLLEGFTEEEKQAIDMSFFENSKSISNNSTGN